MAQLSLSAHQQHLYQLVSAPEIIKALSNKGRSNIVVCAGELQELCVFSELLVLLTISSAQLISGGVGKDLEVAFQLYIVRPPESTEYSDPFFSFPLSQAKSILQPIYQLLQNDLRWPEWGCVAYLLTGGDGASKTVSVSSLVWVFIIPRFEHQPLIM